MREPFLIIRICRLLRHQTGAAALEFALVMLPFMLLILAVLEVSYDLFVQVTLDHAVAQAARGVQVGTLVGGQGATAASTLAANAVCPNISGLLDCANVIIAVGPVQAANFATNSNPTLTAATAVNGFICTGGPSQIMLLQAWYLGPTFLGGLFPSFSTIYNGNRVHITASASGFVNEAFSGGQTTGSGC